MKAMVHDRYGMTDVLTLKEVKKPVIQYNEVLVKVHYVSVNSWDWDLLRGKPLLARIGGWLKPKYNILGADIAGRVEAVGSKVNHLRPGDEVFGDISGCGWGGFAEYVCVNENALSLKPSSMTFEQAAVLALQGLRNSGQIQEGQKVLINGAGGGVGTFGLQIAKLHGAEVTCVDSGEKLGMLEVIGADYVIDYKRILKPEGTYVMVGGTLSLIFQILFLGPIIFKRERKNMKILVHKPNKGDQDILRDLFIDGTLQPVIDKSYSLSQVADAIQYLGEGNVKGKIVICLE